MQLYEYSPAQQAEGLKRRFQPHHPQPQLPSVHHTEPAYLDPAFSAGMDQWSGMNADPRTSAYGGSGLDSQFGNAYMAGRADEGMAGVDGVGGQGPMGGALYQPPTEEEMSAVLSQYAPPSSGPFRPSAFTHQSQPSIPSHHSLGIGPSNSGSSMINSGMTGFVPNQVRPYLSVQNANLDPSNSVAAAVAYGHLGYSGGLQAGSRPGKGQMAEQNNTHGSPPMQRPSLQISQHHTTIGATNTMSSQGGNGSWNQGSEQGFHPQQQGLGSQAAGYSQIGGVPTAFRNGGYAADGMNPGSPPGSMSLAAGKDDPAGKRRRMTLAGQTGSQQSEQVDLGIQPGMLSNNFAALTGGNDSMVNSSAAARPPFKHRRSRSGSDLTKPGGQRGHNGDGVPVSQSYPSGNMMTHAPVLAAFTTATHGNLPLSALGGHAASHPPGLGNQVLRGVDINASGSSAASDFTKRKGWTGRVVEELLDFVHVLDTNMKILYASSSVQSLTGWTADELRGKNITDFIHPNDVPAVNREFEKLRSQDSELLMYYRFRKKPKSEKASPGNDSSAGDTGEEQRYQGPGMNSGDDQREEATTKDLDFIVFEASGHPYCAPKLPPPSLKGGKEDEVSEAKAEKEALVSGIEADAMNGGTSSTRSAGNRKGEDKTTVEREEEPKCFFCSCRPYPSKNISMLDSFLELKLENEKLRLLIADMDLSGPDVEAEQSKSSFNVAYHPDVMKDELESSSEMYAGSFKRASAGSIFGYGAGRPGMRQSVSSLHSGQKSTGLSRNNSIGSHPTSPTLKNVAKDDQATGLGVSAAPDDSDEDPASPTNTANGTASIAGTTEDARRKKKPKQDDGDHVCTDCGRVDSPEWRKGPLGPKTLCNACGLRWAKKIKRKGGDPNAVVNSVANAAALQGQGQTGLAHPHGYQQMSNMSMPPPHSGPGPTMGMMLGPGGVPPAPAYGQRPSFEGT
ncbi:hypothetical protein IE53DRAFT_147419 [Violaceomyces palustris]|uniref:Uncharacterized protein n=1 Tax=Violaceomyces palustris TaxID=1673888 RepID=A0ACD0NUI1_9BASI|nr:hypothetical protein IE53DRAFT_147419 [Violaceomyces palustris]